MTDGLKPPFRALEFVRGTRASGTRASGTRASGTRASGTRASGTRASGTRASDTRASDLSALHSRTMNRIDRLFAITLLLQAKRRVRAQDLAQAFEVTERTIYRDMAALSESGVPIVALPGAGYELAEGYSLPPLLFTPHEAAALFLGARLLIATATGRVALDAQAALDRVSAVLPKPMRAEIERLGEIVQFASGRRRFDLEEPTLSLMHRAVRERKVVWLRYHSYRGGSGESEVTEREIEPHQLAFYDGAWYALAYCRLRQGTRDFRLDRVDDLRVLPETFQPRQLDRSMQAPLEALVRFAPHVVRWVRERQHYGYRGDAAEDKRGTAMRYEVQVLDEIRPWLLSWGASAEVLAPAEFRAALRAEAQRLAQLLT